MLWFFFPELLAGIVKVLHIDFLQLWWFLVIILHPLSNSLIGIYDFFILIRNMTFFIAAWFVYIIYLFKFIVDSFWIDCTTITIYFRYIAELFVLQHFCKPLIYTSLDLFGAGGHELRIISHLWKARVLAPIRYSLFGWLSVTFLHLFDLFIFGCL